MKLILQGDRIVGTATDEFVGGDTLSVSDDFDSYSISKYRVVDRQLVPLVPQVVTMRQARIALHRKNLLTTVETSLSSLPEPQKTEALIEWEYATEVQRTSPLVQSLAMVLTLSEQQVDELFVLASAL
jgi:hypothetical protein